MLYKLNVAETRVYDVMYVVEATSEEEARQKAEAGETFSEEEICCDEVVGREVKHVVGGSLASR